MHKIAKATTVVLAALLALAVTGCSGPTSSEFAGKWKVADTADTPFEITLGDDGSATANRSGEGMEGTWKEENGAAIISWKSGWITGSTESAKEARRCFKNVGRGCKTLLCKLGCQDPIACRLTSVETLGHCAKVLPEPSST